MTDYAIVAEGIGKRYQIGAKQALDTLSGTMLRAAASAARRAAFAGGGRVTNEFWALRDVSFSLRSGEVLGIVGRNGAGKSTLLKVLSRITAPTTGHARIVGSVGSMLEVGTGFHPELTGRENIYLNGSILGMTRDRINAQLDEIVAFSGIEQFIDTPVKRYSSGMYLRLAFAVAAHLEPDILIVDEVLAVGDQAFQQKCIGKIAEVTAHGRTVLFVSHNMSAVQRLCSRALMLDRGTVVLDGSPREVVQSYLAAGTEHDGERVWTPGTEPGDSTARMSRIAIVARGEVQQRVDMLEPFTIEVEYELTVPTRAFAIALQLSDEGGNDVFRSSHNLADDDFTNLLPGRYVSRCTFPGGVLNQGQYWVTVFGYEIQRRWIWRVEHVISVELDQTDPQLEREPRGFYPGPVGPRAVRWTQVAAATATAS